MRRAVLGALVVSALASTAACTSSGSSVADNTPVGITTPAASTAVPSETVGLPSDTAAPTTSASSSRPAPTRTTASRPPDTTCPMSSLRLAALRGSGFQGREFAQILFTNKSTKTCTMFGFPGVSLRRAGALLGQPASREPVAPKSVTLRPGESATSDITDFSTCNAPRSDTVRVYPPDSKEFADLPLDLRGCTISVRPVVHE